MSETFPKPIRDLPETDIPLEGVKAYLSQSDTHQIIFMEFEKDVVLPEHSHAAQVGIVLEGKIDLTIAGKTKTYTKGISSSLIERKSRMPQIRDIKGEVVVVYYKPLITKKMRCHRLSQRVNKKGFFLINVYFGYRRIINMPLNLLNYLQIKQFKHSSRFVYAHLAGI